MNHTPEPWELHPDMLSAIYGNGGTELAATTSHGADELVPPVRPTELDIENSKRIVACVNGCKGVSHPETTIPELIAAVKQGRTLAYRESLTRANGQLGEQYLKDMVKKFDDLILRVSNGEEE